MPWRDEMSVDAVEYSDRPKAEGPAPSDALVERGRVAEMEVTDGVETHRAAFQFWREQKDMDLNSPPGNAAGYLAWRVGDAAGEYGVFDGHGQRVWLGEQPARVDDQVFHYVDIGADWRDKIHLHEFIDRIWGEHLQYPDEQDGDLRETARDALVSTDGDASPVYEVDTTNITVTDTFRLQFWRPADSSAVYVASESQEGHPKAGTHGVLGQTTILTDVNRAVSLDDDTLETVVSLVDRVRGDDGTGLTVVD